MPVKKNNLKRVFTGLLISVGALLPLRPALSAEEEYQSLGILPEEGVKAAKTVVLFKTERGTGSGIIVSSDGHIVTSLHVLNTLWPRKSGDRRMPQRIKVTLSSFYNSESVNATISGTEESLDVALLRLDARSLIKLKELKINVEPIHVQQQLENPPRDFVFLLGNRPQCESDCVSARKSYVRNDPDEFDFSRVDGTIPAGFSGGVIVNPVGEAYGVIVSKETDTSFIPLFVLKDFLWRNGIELVPAYVNYPEQIREMYMQLQQLQKTVKAAQQDLRWDVHYEDNCVRPYGRIRTLNFDFRKKYPEQSTPLMIQFTMIVNLSEKGRQKVSKEASLNDTNDSKQPSALVPSLTSNTATLDGIISPNGESGRFSLMKEHLLKIFGDIKDEFAKLNLGALEYDDVEKIAISFTPFESEKQPFIETQLENVDMWPTEEKKCE